MLQFDQIEVVNMPITPFFEKDTTLKRLFTCPQLLHMNLLQVVGGKAILGFFFHTPSTNKLCNWNNSRNFMQLGSIRIFLSFPTTFARDQHCHTLRARVDLILL